MGLLAARARPAQPRGAGDFDGLAGEWRIENLRRLPGGTWDRIARGACRWRQAVPADGGRSGMHDRGMDWRHA